MDKQVIDDVMEVKLIEKIEWSEGQNGSYLTLSWMKMLMHVRRLSSSDAVGNGPKEQRR